MRSEAGIIYRLTTGCVCVCVCDKLIVSFGQWLMLWNMHNNYCSRSVLSKMFADVDLFRKIFTSGVADCAEQFVSMEHASTVWSSIQSSNEMCSWNYILSPHTVHRFISEHVDLEYRELYIMWILYKWVSEMSPSYGNILSLNRLQMTAKND